MQTQQISRLRNSHRPRTVTGISDHLALDLATHEPEDQHWLGEEPFQTSHPPSARRHELDPWLDAFQPRDATLVIGERDPTSVFQYALQDELATAKTISARVRAVLRELEHLLSQVREAHERQEYEDSLDGDVVLYGEPKHRTRRQGRIVRRRRAEPLVVAEDFRE